MIITEPPDQEIKIKSLFRGLRLTLFTLAAWFFGLVLYVTLSRISYPFDLEWMENASLIQVLRLLDGKLLYVEPNLEYIPTIYPPFYYYLSSLVAKIIAVRWFLPLRLVSLSASFGIILMIFVIVFRETHSRYWAFIAACFFSATFLVGGAWFDIARVDTLSVFLVIFATFWLGMSAYPTSLFAGLLFTCAFFTKQTSLLMISGLLVCGFIFQNRRNAILAGLTFVMSSSLWLWYEYVQSSGWFWYYFFILPSLHSLPHPGRFYFGQPIIMILPVLIAFCVCLVWYFFFPVQVFKEKSGLWTVLAITMLAASILASLNPGSFNNNYIPFYASFSILFGISMPSLLNRFNSRQVFKQALFYTLIISQFLVLLYNPISQIPTAADLHAGQMLVTKLKSVDGEILIPNHNAIAILAGKKTYAHLIALEEIRGNFGQPEALEWNRISAEIRSDISSHKFAAIVLDQPNQIWADVPKYYAETRIDYPNQNVFQPVTGGRTRPQSIFTPALVSP